jgi:hypothetical protein
MKKSRRRAESRARRPPELRPKAPDGIRRGRGWARLSAGLRLRTRVVAAVKARRLALRSDARDTPSEAELLETRDDQR